MAFNCIFLAVAVIIFLLKGDKMSGSAPKTRPVVPEGKAHLLTTRQKEITEGAFFVGYDTIWESFQKEVEYVTPKRP